MLPYRLFEAVLIANCSWEDLEEKPVEGQWTYFDRTN